ncbi:ABC transporter permease [Ferrimonas balearica]|uniref:ABC transporter permease n=1 Tax=Ferrimonas balearica TaxID=44012 RepID=UPI001C5A21B6|nr:ABC transporter permease [Ferrimonas balearica]MBY6017277.1 ABC transporter permease [Halomonas denitrificans]MBW3140223.1 ABC transporter permease [Ferrimonas balearica]MBW3166232.1 ABC transporter permease [Ferrimonas balearica]MBY6093553.1 ABC transporter permease [Ferrimonas balearica]MBY6224775.1 ABC transporter permease [Ferrimonas balearica]
MYTYLLRRLNLLVLTTLVLLGLLYAATLAMPGDPISNLSGIQEPTLAEEAEVIHRYRLDQSTLSGYLAYVQHRLAGDLGYSLSTGEPVMEQVRTYLPASLELAAVAMMMALLVGIPFGILAASRRGLLAKILWALTLLGFSLPVFWLGLLLMLTFGIELDWLPPSGRFNLLYDVPDRSGFVLLDIMMSDAPWRWAALRDAVNHLILPAAVLATLPTTIIVRTIRIAMLAEMDKNYIRALTARGVHRARLVLFHALPNAMAPLFRTLSLQIGSLASSAIIVEVIFSWPGLGGWVLSALHQGDFTALQGGILVISLFIIVLGIVMEILQALLNPISRKEIHG